MKDQFVWTGPRAIRGGNVTIEPVTPFSWNDELMGIFGGLIRSSPNRMMSCETLKKKASSMGVGNLRSLLKRAGFDVIGNRDQLEAALVRHLDGEEIAPPKKRKSKADARREQVVILIGEGMTPEEIAANTGVTLGTTHRDIDAILAAQAEEE